MAIAEPELSLLESKLQQQQRTNAGCLEVIQEYRHMRRLLLDLVGVVSKGNESEEDLEKSFDKLAEIIGRAEKDIL